MFPRPEVGGLAIPSEKSQEIAAASPGQSHCNLSSCINHESLFEDIGRQHLLDGSSIQFVKDTVAIVSDAEESRIIPSFFQIACEI